MGPKTAARSQEIPSGACWYYQFPKMWLVVLEAWYFHQTGMGVVLEAQFYTRRVGRMWSKMITAARGDET